MITFETAVWIWIAIAIITFSYLVFSGVRAPYGRHSSKSWGPMIANKWGWFLMELPAFLICPLLAIIGPVQLDLVSWIAVGLWSVHYFNRVFLFPFKIKTKGKKMPWFIVISAMLFNGVNGFLNGYFFGFIGTASQSVLSMNVIIGILVFFGGMYINTKTDRLLIALRKKQAGYQIPRGWLFKYISCPNHFGEIVEWIGFAILAWNLPALSFAIWTFCNLVPRALNHHNWYQEHFLDYPKRKAVMPYLF